MGNNSQVVVDESDETAARSSAVARALLSSKTKRRQAGVTV